MNADRAHGAHDERTVTVLHLRRLAAGEGLHPFASRALASAAEDFALLRHRKGHSLAQHTEAIQAATRAWVGLVTCLQEEAVKSRQHQNQGVMQLIEVLRLLGQTNHERSATRRSVPAAARVHSESAGGQERAPLKNRLWGFVQAVFRQEAKNPTTPELASCLHREREAAAAFLRSLGPTPCSDAAEDIRLGRHRYSGPPASQVEVDAALTIDRLGGGDG